jgi:hypothetical protein
MGAGHLIKHMLVDPAEKEPPVHLRQPVGIADPVVDARCTPSGGIILPAW